MASDLDKMRARLRAAQAPKVADVRAPIDEESINCLDCGGSGMVHAAVDAAKARSKVACSACGGSGLRYAGEPIARGVKPSKVLSTAYVDGAWLDGDAELRLTLTSDPPDAARITMCDADIVLTGPAPITPKPKTFPAEVRVRFSNTAFLQVGVMICFGVVHAKDGTILATFPLPNVIHSGGDYNVDFTIDMDATARELLKTMPGVFEGALKIPDDASVVKVETKHHEDDLLAFTKPTKMKPARRPKLCAMCGRMMTGFDRLKRDKVCSACASTGRKGTAAR